MTGSLRALALALIAPLLLMGCVLTPGKFVATLDIARDRSFTFTYVGEVWALNLDAMKGLGKASADEDKPDPDEAPAAKAKPGEDDADTERKNREIADALRKEAGYRRVEYLGKGRFQIDFAIAGRLTHGFVYPFNMDAGAVFPFLAIELRGPDMVRVKAPAFAANSDSSKSMPGAPDAADKLDGSFTLTTDAEIVSQNNEGGASATGGKRSITWKATPLTKDAPMAVLKLAPIR